MSGGGDNVFARWSRRKQAARSGAAAPAPDADNLEAPATTPVEQVDREPAKEEPDAGEPLPRLEDLTAESDLSAFLRKDVPQALKSAAMRKVWSLDPAIRDYVGPSEYAWDFNKAGSMAGFGPLDAAESVAEFLSTMSGGTRSGSAQTAMPEAAPQPSPEQQNVAVSAEHDADVSPGSPARPASPAEQSAPPPAPAGARVPADPEEPPQAAVPRRHGGAMPR